MTKAPETSKQENKKTSKKRKKCVNMKKSTITSRCVNGKELKSILKRGVPNSLQHMYDNIAESQCVPPIFETGIMKNIRFNQTVIYKGKAYTAGETVQLDEVHAEVLMNAGIDIEVTDVTENDVE